MDILSLAITGVIVSLLVTGIKKFTKTSTTGNYVAVVGLSVLGGVFWHYTKDTSFLKTATEVLVYANGVYAFVISKFE